MAGMAVPFVQSNETDPRQGGTTVPLTTFCAFKFHPTCWSLPIQVKQLGTYIDRQILTVTMCDGSLKVSFFVLTSLDTIGTQTIDLKAYARQTDSGTPTRKMSFWRTKVMCLYISIQSYKLVCTKRSCTLWQSTRYLWLKAIFWTDNHSHNPVIILAH